MQAFLLLGTWSYRRVRTRFLFWGRFLRLIIDWITFFYIILPGLAVLTFVLWRYFHGAYTAGIVGTEIGGQVPVQLLTIIAITGIVFVWHLMMYGNIPFSLESGDKVFVLLSPFSRKQLLTTLWIEGFVSSTVPLVILYVFSLPWLPVLHLAWQAWFAILMLVGIYEGLLRLFSQTLNERDSFSWRRWFLFNGIRYISFLPVVFCVPTVLGGQGWSLVLLFFAFVFAFSWVTFRALLWRPWDSWMQFRPNRLINLAVPVDFEDVSRVQFRMRIPSAWVVRMIERIGRKTLRPMTWLLLLRILRRKQLFRDLGLITAAAITAESLAPLLWVKFFGLGFCALLLAQWWMITVKPLAEKPIEEQTAVDEFALKVTVNQLMMNTMIGFMLFWLLIGWLWHGL